MRTSSGEGSLSVPLYRWWATLFSTPLLGSTPPPFFHILHPLQTFPLAVGASFFDAATRTAQTSRYPCPPGPDFLSARGGYFAFSLLEIPIQLLIRGRPLETSALALGGSFFRRLCSNRPNHSPIRSLLLRTHALSVGGYFFRRRYSKRPVLSHDLSPPPSLPIAVGGPFFSALLLGVSMGSPEQRHSFPHLCFRGQRLFFRNFYSYHTGSPLKSPPSLPKPLSERSAVILFDASP